MPPIAGPSAAPSIARARPHVGGPLLRPLDPAQQDERRRDDKRRTGRLDATAGEQHGEGRREPASERRRGEHHEPRGAEEP